MSTPPGPRPLRVLPVPGPGAEDVVVDHEGRVWTGTADGALHRIDPRDGSVATPARTGGRPLGLELFPDGRILVADAHRGLLAVEPATGAVEELVTTVDGVSMRFCNNAAVHSGGDIYFSDSSTRFGIEDWKDDLVQRTATGRLLVRRTDGTVEILLDGLVFANGVALSAEETFVAVAQTGARDVVRHWIAGPRDGERDLLVADLPGYPDNIARGSDGLIWVTLASPTDPVVEWLQLRAPRWLTRVVTRVPDRVQPQPKRTVRVQAFDDGGTLVHDLQGESADFHMVTGVREHDGVVWLGSLAEPAVAAFRVDGRPLD